MYGRLLVLVIDKFGGVLAQYSLCGDLAVRIIFVPLGHTVD